MSILWMVFIGVIILVMIGAGYYWRDRLRDVVRNVTNHVRGMFTSSSAAPALPASPSTSNPPASPSTSNIESVTVILSVIIVAMLFGAVTLMDNPIALLIRFFLLAWMGVMAALFVIPLVPPLMDKLMIKPNRNRPDGTEPQWPYKPSRSGFFTDLQPGRVKMIETWEGSFIRALMDYNDRVFAGELSTNIYTPDMQQYWEVKPTPDDAHDSNPLPFPGPKNKGTVEWWVWIVYSPFSTIWWSWKRYVYRLRGAVFVGLPGFRTLHIYPLDRFKFKVGRDRESVHTDTELELVQDYSDHFRVAQFEFPVFIPTAETSNMVPVKAMLNPIFETVNPYFLAYNTDDQWPHRLFSAVSNAIATYTRSRPIKEVNPADAATEVTAILGETVKPMGIAIVQTLVIDLTPADAEQAKRLGEPEIARAYREAAEERARGDAAPLRESGKALQEYPQAAFIAQAEVTVRVARAMAENPNAFVFLGDPRNINPLDAAQLNRLNQLLLQQGQGGN